MNLRDSCSTPIGPRCKTDPVHAMDRLPAMSIVSLGNTMTSHLKLLTLRVSTVIVSLAVLAGCGSSDLERNEPGMGAANEATTTRLNDINESTRLLTVYLQPDTDSGYQPVYVDRIVIAQSMLPQIAKNAEGRMLVQGIDTVVVGSSCEDLLQRYPEITECAIVDTMEVSYGEIQSSATTDQEGFAALEVGPGDVRVSVRSWPTVEDNKCHWSGSSVAKNNTTSLAIPLLVFCE
jgi:hypothetical protein